MTDQLFTYSIDQKYDTKVAYFSMEFAIEQALKIYSGGLGFLAGSHMRSVYDLKQHVLGIGMFWKFGYYDQVRNDDGSLTVAFIQKFQSFLEDTGIRVTVRIFDKNVTVKALYLSPEIFHTAPLILLSTDCEENEPALRGITDKLYDDNKYTRLAQYTVLGIGGAKVMDALGFDPDVYHLNEAHALPAAFYLLDKFQDVKEVRKRLVFTTHTPEEAGNEKADFHMMQHTGCFGGLRTEAFPEIFKGNTQVLNFSLIALRLAKIANAVSKIHGRVSNEMWRSAEGISKITSITNSQNKNYWKNDNLETCLTKNDTKGLQQAKKKLKSELFAEVADQTGKLFDPDILTIVWARRFAGYKRADLIMRHKERFAALIANTRYPIQIIWAGKPYPFDSGAIHTFNSIFRDIRDLKNCAILLGYELRLSRLLKQGSDLWLNNPRFSREASGTSGMTAAMNGSVNFSISDGWVDEFAYHGINSFVIPHADTSLTHELQDDLDAESLYNVLENEILPIYYDDKPKWMEIVKTSMQQVFPMFDSARMADEYYRKIYNAKVSTVRNIPLEMA